jgi:UDP-glucose 4-epimerase
VDYCITGGNGFIGTNLVNFLRTKGKSLEVIDLNPTNTDTITLDVSYCLPQFHYDTLVHLASETNVRDSIRNPGFTIKKNIDGILVCLHHLKFKNSNRLIFTSSVSSSESRSPYLASKSACESICKSYKDSYGLDILILRLSNVYGPYSLEKESVIAKFIKNCLNKLPIIIYGDGHQSRDFIHVDDVVRCLYEGIDGFISTGRLTSINSIANMISNISCELTGFRPRIIYENSINGEVKIPIPRTDICPSIKIDEGLVSTFEWFKENYATK